MSESISSRVVAFCVSSFHPNLDGTLQFHRLQVLFILFSYKTDLGCRFLSFKPYPVS